MALIKGRTIADQIVVSKNIWNGLLFSIIAITFLLMILDKYGVPTLQQVLRPILVGVLFLGVSIWTFFNSWLVKKINCPNCDYPLISEHHNNKIRAEKYCPHCGLNLTTDPPSTAIPKTIKPTENIPLNSSENRLSSLKKSSVLSVAVLGGISGLLFLAGKVPYLLLCALGIILFLGFAAFVLIFTQKRCSACRTLFFSPRDMFCTHCGTSAP